VAGGRFRSYAPPYDWSTASAAVSDDAEASSQADIVSILREMQKNGPEPRPPTPEEIAEIRARNAEIAKKALSPVGGPPLIELTEPVPVEQIELRPIEVVIAGDRRRPPRIVSRRGRATRRGREGAPDRLYPSVEIARVLIALADDPEHSQTSLASRALPRTAVRRVIRLDRHGAFSLGPRGGLRLLGTNGEFRAAGKEVPLRVLERVLGLEPFA
jgi:hypothetical protein